MMTSPLSSPPSVTSPLAPAPRVLVVDDDADVRLVLRALLAQQGYDTAEAGGMAVAVRAIERHVTGQETIDVVICDVRMPDGDGLELLRLIGERCPRLPVVMLTAYGTVPLAVEAMRCGAVDVVCKPFEREALVSVLDRARRGEPDVPGGRGLHRLLGDAPAMRQCKDLIERAARGDTTVLLRGETGTGKELAARALHDLSPRREGPFVRVHCAALPDTLLESELFGHEAGAFTGAIRRKAGRVEMAEGGTLFLDEIGDITPAVQVKLLHLLQEREYCRLGATSSSRADVRFVAATHRDLESLVATGEFREDLFYRLNVVPIFMPPLRARQGDIAALVIRFVERHAGRLPGAARTVVEPDAIERLTEEPWPGNVRQLENFVERLVVLAPEGLHGTRRVGAADVERELERVVRRHPSEPPMLAGGLVEQRRDAERRALESALRQAGGNRSQAARILGISRRTLYKKLEQQGLS